MASPATPAPELELGVIQRTVILDTSLSPPRGIGHQLLWISSSGSSVYPPIFPHWQQDNAEPGASLTLAAAPWEVSLPYHLASWPIFHTSTIEETFLKQSGPWPSILKTLPWGLIALR